MNCWVKQWDSAEVQVAAVLLIDGGGAVRSPSL